MIPTASFYCEVGGSGDITPWETTHHLSSALAHLSALATQTAHTLLAPLCSHTSLHVHEDGKSIGFLNVVVSQGASLFERKQSMRTMIFHRERPSYVMNEACTYSELLATAKKASHRDELLSLDHLDDVRDRRIWGNIKSDVGPSGAASEDLHLPYFWMLECCIKPHEAR